jgi:hypothetical protein
MLTAAASESRAQEPSFRRIRRWPFQEWRRTLWFGAAASIGSIAVAVVGAASSGDPLPADYWTLPVPAQGEAPAAWSVTERSLRPEACGECHQDHYAEWHGSLHAQAFSPGLVGQLLTFDREAIAACLQCHAPLVEQRQAFLAQLSGAPADPAPVPAEAGNSCASSMFARIAAMGRLRRRAISGRPMAGRTAVRSIQPISSDRSSARDVISSRHRWQ